jgi:SAM-dependent methyltransferase
MTVGSLTENRLHQNANGVWVLEGHERFGYSEGEAAERYLRGVMTQASDLSSRSTELGRYIHDWSSEYHLSVKRGQLLSGFTFDRGMRVLEIGCGCGAISRVLGETFDEVISVEGNLARAEIARLRTRDLSSVEVVCAPFQALEFNEKFDLIVCVGVYEYSRLFVDAEDPYDAVLRQFAGSLNPDGVLLLAIENQFGLKYFASSGEDHVGAMFAGIEGYHRFPADARTFGKPELTSNLRRYFKDVEFYYPYPDYKMPDCVVSESFLSSGRAAELVSQFRSRDYAKARTALWDEAPAILELARNGQLAFFANSFLAIASTGNLRGVRFDQQAVIYSTERRPEFAAATRVVERDARLVAAKRRVGPPPESASSRLRLVEGDSEWIDRPSLQTEVLLKAYPEAATLEEIFAPCRSWVDALRAVGVPTGDRLMIGGEHVDSIWSNAYVVDGRCTFVDREWVWDAPIALNVLAIRAVFNLLQKADGTSAGSAALKSRSGKSLIAAIGAVIGLKLTEQDFDDFVQLESAFQSTIFTTTFSQNAAYLRWYLLDRPSLGLFKDFRVGAARVSAKVRRVLGRGNRVVASGAKLS